MDQLENMASVIAITVYKVNQKIMTKKDLWYQIRVAKRAKKVLLVLKIFSSC